MNIIFLGCRKCKRLDITVEQKDKRKRSTKNNNNIVNNSEVKEDNNNISTIKEEKIKIKKKMDYPLTNFDVRVPKETQIIDDYEISNHVLGLGINGKVVQCFDRKTREKYALKVIIIIYK